MKKTFLIALILICSSAIHGQQPASNAPFKIAALDIDSILTIMPEYKTASDEAQKYYDKLNEQMQEMQQELTALITEAGNNPSDRDKQKIAAKQQEVTDFQTTAQDKFTSRRSELMTPIFVKLHTAAQKVAARDGYAFVLDTSKSGDVIFAAEAYNIFDDVCKELGIPVPNH